jgi:hypothetical protein
MEAWAAAISELQEGAAQAAAVPPPPSSLAKKRAAHSAPMPTAPPYSMNSTVCLVHSTDDVGGYPAAATKPAPPRPHEPARAPRGNPPPPLTLSPDHGGDHTQVVRNPYAPLPPPPGGDVYATPEGGESDDDVPKSAVERPPGDYPTATTDGHSVLAPPQAFSSNEAHPKGSHA